MRIEVHPHKKARIEIIPLIDVIFFCLATFVLYTLQLNKNQELPVKLPQTSITPNRESAAEEPVLLTVTEDGSLYWNRDPMSPEQFRVRLADYLRDEASPKLLINGEERANFGKAVELMDQILKTGLDRERVSFVTAIRTIPRG